MTQVKYIGVWPNGNLEPDAVFETLDAAIESGWHMQNNGCYVMELRALDHGEPEILDDTSPRAVVGEIGNQIHNIGCEYQENWGLSERLGEIASECWSVAQQLSPEPAPDHSD